MRILVTNDDGVGRPGLRALVRVLADDGHEVRVLAPTAERSGSSSSLGTVTHGARLEMWPVELEGCGHVVAHTVDAPPALAVRAACIGALDWIPELVVAGINPGFNTGRMVLHSGTVGAALTAASRDITGIAVSTANEEPAALTTAAVLACWLAELVPAADLPPVALNLNVPPLPLERLGGVLDATLSETSISDVSFEADPTGLRVHRWQNPPPFERGTDADLLSRGWASLSSISSPWATAPAATTLAADLQRRWTEGWRPDGSVSPASGGSCTTTTG